LRTHAGHGFTTKDRDNDIYKDNCAEHCQGAWWYNDCYTSNLNGLYQGQNGHNNYLGTTWNTLLGNSYSLKKVEMKLRAI
ncbi:Ficolin-2, partial [Lamellibrachia satsuma]